MKYMCGFVASSWQAVRQDSTDLAGLGHAHSALTTEDLVALFHVDNDRLRQFKNRFNG
jgi:hypothetical protein